MPPKAVKRKSVVLFSWNKQVSPSVGACPRLQWRHDGLYDCPSYSPHLQQKCCTSLFGLWCAGPSNRCGCTSTPLTWLHPRFSHECALAAEKWGQVTCVTCKQTLGEPMSALATALCLCHEQEGHVPAEAAHKPGSQQEEGTGAELSRRWLALTCALGAHRPLPSKSWRSWGHNSRIWWAQTL